VRALPQMVQISHQVMPKSLVLEVQTRKKSQKIQHKQTQRRHGDL